MSSNEDDFDGESPSGMAKKRRIQRACDICRRKKIRCDGVQMPGNRCSNCAAYSLKCTYVETAKKRGPSKGYVEGLEQKVDKMDKLLRRLCTNESTYHAIMNAMERNDGVLEQELLDPNSLMGTSSPSQPGAKSPTLLDTVTRAIRNTHRGQAVAIDDVGVMVADLKDMSIDAHDEHRFFGKSSGAVLVRNVMEARREYVGQDKSNNLSNIRPEFWIIPKWERATRVTISSQPLDYPPTDLAGELIDHYFRHFNLYLPLLHRPTFEEGVKANLYRTDTGFALVYMLVCSLGSKFSDDPRVKCDGEESSHSAGWKWFNQTIMLMKTPMAAASINDVQAYALAAQFLSASASPQNCWTLTGIGLRVAQDVGAHIMRPRRRSPAEDESWKRAFWVLVVLDRLFSSSLGRPCAIHEEDFDLDLPNDCNDEYWDNEDPTKCFQQPENVPSKITAFILLIELTRVLYVTLRTIYATNKSTINLAHQLGPWEETVVAELDSALNTWVDLVPAHLRWEPDREDEEFFDQSVVLHSHFYLLQIIVHRPFIPNSLNKPSPLSFPSLAICANAARSCSHLLDLQRRRTLLSPLNYMPVCMAAILLLLNLWSGKKSGLSNEMVNKNMADVQMCMQAMGSAERRWQAAGRLWDLLYVNAGDLALPQSKPASSHKRPRGSDGPQVSHQSKEALPNEDRNIRRVPKESSLPLPGQGSPGFSQHASPSNSSVSETSVDSSFAYPSLQSLQGPLPMYSQELGQLPLHGPFTPVAAQHPQVAHPQIVHPTTSSSTSSAGWYPTHTENAGIDQSSASTPYSRSSSSSLHHQSLTSDVTSHRSMDPGTDPRRGSGYPMPLQSSLHGAFDATPMINQSTRFDVPLIHESPLHQQVQGHRQQLGNVSQINTGISPGIDMDTINSNAMAMWLNASPSLLEDWGAFFPTF